MRANTCISCAASIRWVLTRTGKRMPLDPKPSETGNVLINADGTALVMTARDQETLVSTAPRYVSHFATCPHAGHHRRRS